MYQPRRYWARQAALQARPGHDGNSALYLPLRLLAHTPERRSRSEHPAQRLPMSTTSIIFGQSAAPKEGAKPLAHRGLAQAVRCRLLHQPRRPPLAKIRPGRPAPAWVNCHRLLKAKRADRGRPARLELVVEDAWKRDFRRRADDGAAPGREDHRTRRSDQGCQHRLWDLERGYRLALIRRIQHFR
jgi:hypothetical protein